MGISGKTHQKSILSFHAKKYLVVGLGNPGDKYKNTRHNAGFMCIDKMMGKFNVLKEFSKFRGMCSECNMNGKNIVLLKPTTFMNESGRAVSEAVSFYKIPPENTVLVFDDITLPVGKIRIRRNGTHGGHNGVRSIVNLCGGEIFPRVKIGIGKKPGEDWDLADWVLSAFKEDEKDPLENALNNATDAVELIICGKVEEAMNKFN